MRTAEKNNYRIYISNVKRQCHLAAFLMRRVCIEGSAQTKTRRRIKTTTRGMRSETGCGERERARRKTVNPVRSPHCKSLSMRHTPHVSSNVVGSLVYKNMCPCALCTVSQFRTVYCVPISHCVLSSVSVNLERLCVTK